MCSDCGEPFRLKDYHALVYRTLFEKLSLKSPRFYTCDCQPREPKGPVAKI